MFDSIVKEAKAIVIVLILLALCFGSGFLVADCGGKSEIDRLLSLQTGLQDDITVSKNKVKSLNTIIKQRDDEKEELLSLIASLKSKPAEIRYIVKTETILVGNNNVLPELPEEYIYKLNDELPVARFAQEKNEEELQYRFETYDLTFRGEIVIAEKDTALLLKATSSYDPATEYLVPVTSLDVTHVREQKLFTPHIGIGLTVSAPALDLSASLYTTLFHPRDDLDILGIRMSANRNNFRFGIDPIYYNLGKPIPVITNMWIAAGVSMDIHKQANFDITIGGKL